MRPVYTFCTLLLLAPSIGTAAPIDDLVEYRTRVMESAQRHLRATSSIVEDGVPLPAHLAEHARALQAFSRMIPEMFPAGSYSAKSDAKPEIWQRWDEFTALAQRLGQHADALAAAGADRKRMQQAYNDLLKTCRSCHDEFRER